MFTRSSFVPECWCCCVMISLSLPSPEGKGSFGRSDLRICGFRSGEYDWFSYLGEVTLTLISRPLQVWAKSSERRGISLCSRSRSHTSPSNQLTFNIQILKKEQSGLTAG